MAAITQSRSAINGLAPTLVMETATTTGERRDYTAGRIKFTIPPPPCPPHPLCPPPGPSFSLLVSHFYPAVKTPVAPVAAVRSRRVPAKLRPFASNLFLILSLRERVAARRGRA